MIVSADVTVRCSDEFYKKSTSSNEQKEARHEIRYTKSTKRFEEFSLSSRLQLSAQWRSRHSMFSKAARGWENRDAANQFTLDKDGKTWQDAYVVQPMPNYHKILGTRYISATDTGRGFPHLAIRYRTTFQLPDGYRQPIICHRYTCRQRRDDLAEWPDNDRPAGFKLRRNAIFRTLRSNTRPPIRHISIRDSTWWNFLSRTITIHLDLITGPWSTTQPNCRSAST